MKELKRASMAEICALVTDGTHDSPKLQDSGVPFIKGKNISGGIVDFTTCDFITEEDHLEACRRVKPKRGDVLFSNIGSVGDTALVNDDREFSIKNVALFRPDTEVVDPAYFYYLVLSPDFRANVMNVRSGSAQPFISLANLRAFEVNYISYLPTQRRIAGILSAYDELIANNQRRIAILEEMARALYREWFVRYNAPGVVMGEDGVPEGWEVRRLREVAQVHRGRSYRSDDLADEGGLPFLNLKCMDREGGFRRTGIKCYTGEFKEHHIVRKGDIIMAVTDMTQERAIVARAAWVPTLEQDFGVMSMDLVRIEPKGELSKVFLYCFLRYSGFPDEVKQHANGANVLHLSPDRITDYPIVLPTVEVMNKFEQAVVGMLELKDTLENQSANLRCTRDLLLPRLMSGRVELNTVEV